MNSKTGTLAFIAVALVTLCGTACFCVARIHKPPFSQIRQTREYQGVERENVQVWKLMKRTAAAGEKWQALAKSNGKKLAEAIEVIELVESSLDAKKAKTPFQFAQDSTRDEFNIEFTIGGHLVYLVGPGAQAASAVLYVHLPVRDVLK